MILGLARKTRSLGEFFRCSDHYYHLSFHNAGKKLSASLLRDNSGSRSSTRDDSRARTEASATDSLQICRVASPDSFVEMCTKYCPMTLPEDRVKAHVVRIFGSLRQYLF